MNILVLYHLRGSYPLRPCIDAHLRCWGRYSQHDVHYHNASFGHVADRVNSLDPDVIILHTSFCGLRWNRDALAAIDADLDSIARHRAVKLAMPQDEFYLTSALEWLLARLDTSIVLTCADEALWTDLYPVLSKSVRFKTVLTGYLDPQFVRRADAFSRPTRDRRIPVSYRAWHAEYWLGHHGQQKVQIGWVFRDALARQEIESDISMNGADTITGDDWIKFLADSRATIGVEGGASLIDRDGSVRSAVADYLEKHPGASFEAVRDACFRERDHELELRCLSPRHLEAVATRTLQFLVGGEYNGILEPGRHYVEIADDFSNLAEALSILDDPDAIDAITDAAYRDIVTAGRAAYPDFVREIEDTLLSGVEARKPRWHDAFTKAVSGLRDWFHWRIIQAEKFYLRDPARLKFLSPLKPIYRRISNQA